MTEAAGGTLVDSNVLLDVLTADPVWARWSADRLAEALDQGPVVINQIVYGEVSLRFATIEDTARYRTYFPSVPLVAPEDA